MRSYCTVFFYCSDPNIESGEWVHVREQIQLGSISPVLNWVSYSD